MKTVDHVFIVEGTGRFPVDMLRYDGCFPFGPDDAARIEGSLRGEWSGAVEVRLVSKGRERSWTPTLARWTSFGWIARDDS